MGVGIGVWWVGYTVAWWGWIRLQGPGGLGKEPNMLDLIVPGRSPFDQRGKLGKGETGGLGGGNLLPSGSRSAPTTGKPATA